MSNIVAIPTAKMTHQDWLETRHFGLGGSDMGKVLGVSKWGTPVDVWLEKTHRKPPIEDNLNMWMGRELEEPVAKRYAEQEGVEVYNYNFMLHDQKHHIVGNMDRLVAIDGKKPAYRSEIRTNKGLEVKTSGQAPWEELPEHYKAQVHTYMALAPAIDVFDIVALFRGISMGLEIYVEERNAVILDYIRQSAKEFWEKYVMEDTPPPPQSEQDCKNLWQASRPEPIIATGEIQEKVEKLHSVREQIKELKEEEDIAKAVIMKYMQEHDTLINSTGKNLITWRTAKDRENVNWKQVALEAGATPDLIKQHTATRQGSRVFRIS